MKDDAVIKHQNGFSLVEMLVILAIIGALSVISFSSFTGGKSRMTPETAAKEVARMVQSARLRAISTRSTVEVVFDVSKRGVEVWGGHRVFDLPKDMSMRLETGKELVLAPSRGSISFYPDGSSSGGHVVFNKKGYQSVGVAMQWLSGAVTDVPPIN